MLIRLKEDEMDSKKTFMAKSWFQKEFWNLREKMWKVSQRMATGPGDFTDDVTQHLGKCMEADGISGCMAHPWDIQGSYVSQDGSKLVQKVD